MPKYTDQKGRALAKVISSQIASAEALAAFPAGKHADGEIFTLADGSIWKYSLAATATDASQTLVVTATEVGAYLRLPGTARLRLPITFATADATALLTVPAGVWFTLKDLFWDVGTNFTGGASSAIGVSSAAKSGLTAKGALLGGASGDLAATLVTTGSPAFGTIGSAFGTIAQRRLIWVPGDVIRFDAITSAFTAGAGAVNLIVDLLQNAGA